MSSTTQRKKRTANTSSSRRNTSKRSQNQTSQTVMETIDVLENESINDDMPLQGEDVVDLTCEGLEPAFVDLTNNDSIVVTNNDSIVVTNNDSIVVTNNDSIVVVEDGVQNRRGPGTESYVLSSDEEEDSSLRLSPGLLSSIHASSQARSTPGAVSCPVCMDAYSEIIESGRLMVSTKCGHLFCSLCIRDSLSRAHSCPTCRKKLTHKQYHPIYI